MIRIRERACFWDLETSKLPSHLTTSRGPDGKSSVYRSTTGGQEPERESVGEVERGSELY